MSPRATGRLSWKGFEFLLGIDRRLVPGAELDAALDRVYERHLVEAASIDRFVLLAFDAYYDDAGRRPPLPHATAQLGSDIYTSNGLVRAACRARPDRFLFGASVHPYRPDAVAAIDEVFTGGACLLKWLPLHQNIDIADPRTVAVLRRCAAVGLPLLVHYNEEFTLATQHPEYRPIGALLDVLRRLRREGGMPTVIVAHVATPVTAWGSRIAYEELLEALRGEFADAPLYADISALTVWGKVPFLRRIARMQELHHKLLFGTDFPVPVLLLRVWRDLGREYRRVAALRSWAEQILAIDRVLGFNEIVFHRAAEVLPNVDYFTGAAAARCAAPPWRSGF